MARVLGVLGMLFFFTGCGGDEMEGPERSRYEMVDRADFEIERGRVQIFGSRGQKGAVVDRWMRPRDGFSKLDEFLEHRRLVVQARCRSRGECDVRYDLGLSRTARTQVELEEGELRLVKIVGPITAKVKKGRVVGETLSSSEVDVEVEDGRVQLKFVEAPETLRIRMERGEATIFVPDRSFRCEFDREAPQFNLDKLRCHPTSLRTIRIEPGEAKVRFGVVDMPE